MKAKISILFDKRKILTTGPDKGRCHIKLLGSFPSDQARVRRYFKTDVYATPAEFARITGGNPGRNQELQDKQTALYTLFEKAKAIVKDNPFIDPEQFGYELTNAGSFKSPLSLMESYADTLQKEGKIGTSEYYRQAISSFKEFAGEHFTFGSVTPTWLMKYEKWMTIERREKVKDKAGNEKEVIIPPRSITTVGMYCRAMRTIYNMAIDKKKVPAAQYPFGKGKYVIPTGKGRKLALSEVQKDKLLSFRTLNPAVQKAVDLWIFSYFCYGMNFADVARLKYADIKDKSIIFERSKTVNTERDRSFIEIPVMEKVSDIIKRWGNPADSNAYIFPVLRGGLTPKQVNDRVHDFIQDTNADLATACGELQIPKMTTYWARHTFATIAYKKGAGLEFIQKALGHSDIKTTQAYINSFDMETRQMVSNWL